MSEFSIEVEHLRREFRLDRMARRDAGKVLTALSDVNLKVKRGELFGLLGPNGAGKTTLIRILCTLLSPTGGRALIEDFDVVSDVKKVRPIINMVSGGETCGYGILTATENLRLFTEMYGIPWKIARLNVEKMLHVVGLDKFKGVRVNKLSTGMRQRVNFARGFTTNPKVIFLDEPTVGMDINSARDIRNFVRGWMIENPASTMLLTTHYMAEADEMCDRIAIVDQGVIQVCDTPENLKKLVHKETALELTIDGDTPPPDHWQALPGVVKLMVTVNSIDKVTSLRALLADADAGGAFIASVTANGRRLLGLKTLQPTLEDVFIKLTGRRLAEAAPKPEADAV